MKRILTSLILALCFASNITLAQDAKLDKAMQSGTQLPVRIAPSVEPNVTAQAVLIPRTDARRIFGSEIANNYAVIEVNVGNKSGDAALIIHGIFMDYEGWALSGTSSRGPASASLAATDPRRATAEPFQASTIPSQVASEEYRVVRGQLLDAQTWSRRNWTMRILTFAGNLAGAYAFSLNEEGIVKGLNAFSGVFVPGFKEVWPDGTIEQLNRVSDFGYQANKVIPRQGAEVIVCFFPIDRFLTPGFKKLFQKSPALFFAPLQMLVDKKLAKDADGLIKGLDSGMSVNELREALPCYLSVSQGALSATPVAGDNSIAAVKSRGVLKTCQQVFGLSVDTDSKGVATVGVANETNFKKLLILDFISQMSLNNVRVTVDGVMTLDTTNMAARPDGVKFDRVANCGDDTTPCFWGNTAAADGVRTGTIDGAYMTAGSVMIAEASDLGITELKTITEGSTDQALNFSFKLTRPVPPDRPLHFVVQKVQTGAAGTATRNVSSLPWEYHVGYQPEAPKIKGATLENGKVTVDGSGFRDTPPTYPLVVSIESATLKKTLEVKPTTVEENKLVFPLPDDADPGCWSVKVGIGPNGALPAVEEGRDCSCFAVLPTPTLDAAEVRDNTIVVTGDDLFDTGLCGGDGEPLNFQLIKDDEPNKPRKAAIVALFRDGKQATLALPVEAKTGKWHVQVLLGLTAVEEGKHGRVELNNSSK